MVGRLVVISYSAESKLEYGNIPLLWVIEDGQGRVSVRGSEEACWTRLAREE